MWKRVKKREERSILPLEIRSLQPKEGYGAKKIRSKNGNNQEEHEESILNRLENINSFEELAKHVAEIILSLG